MLIYKATELVNFAQGDLLMLGAFVAYMAVVWWGLDYWLGTSPLMLIVFFLLGATAGIYTVIRSAMQLNREAENGKDR